MPKFKNEFIRGISGEAYRALPGINASMLKKETAMDSHREVSTERVLSASLMETFAIGEAIHIALLESEDFERRLVVVDTKGLNTRVAEQAREENPGKLIVNQRIKEVALNVRDSAYKHDAAREILKSCPDTEVSAVAEDSLTGAPLKCRIDLRPPDGANYLADVKSVSNISLLSFKRSLVDYGYLIQAAFYLDVNNMLAGEERTAFSFILTMKTPPYHVRVVEVAPEDIEAGRAVYRSRLDRYLDELSAIEAGDLSEFEGYKRHGVELIQLTDWQRETMING